jgi:hypothetical protein
MQTKRRRKARLFAALFLGAAVLAGTFALTASNTVPASKAGDGSGAITGYAVSAVHYTLNGTDPTKIDEVSFTVDAAPKAGSTIRIKLESAGSTWYSCTNVSTAVTCATTSPQANVLPSNELRVVVAD